MISKMSKPTLNLSPNLKRKSGANKNSAVKKKVTKLFEFGNYDRYYGYRNVDGLTDPRLDAFNTRKELFASKDILDVGCNIGHISYSVARDLGAKTLLGIDIDNFLIQTARKNVRYYNCVASPAVMDLMKKCDLSEESGTTLMFPNNVSFLHGNYVPYDDSLLAREEPKYDVILCLSVSKWIHLNWGDDGLKRTFKKIFIQLRPGGVFLLEAQPFESYKKKKLSAKLRQNSQKLKFLPQMFNEFLLSEIGFRSCETLEVPSHTSKGFQRPIELYFKS